jgi:hypothetical protein
MNAVHVIEEVGPFKDERRHKNLLAFGMRRKQYELFFLTTGIIKEKRLREEALRVLMT